MGKLISSIFIFCFYSFLTNSQPITFQRTYDTLGYYYSSCVRQTLDNGFIMCGSNYTMSNAQDVAIIKTDSGGNVQWVKTYGGTATDGATTLEITNDTNYFVWGVKDNISATQEDLWLLKLNSLGDTIFSKILSFGPGENFPKASCRTLDNGYALTGYTSAIGNGLQDIFLIKLNSQGDTLWTKIYGGLSTERSYDIKQTSDSGYIITGSTGSFNVSIQDIYTIKTDKNGDTLWTRTFGFVNNDFGLGVTETSDYGFLVSGTVYDTAGTGYNIALIKYNSLGQFLWYKEFLFPNEDEPVAIHSLINGNFILCANTTNTQTLKYEVLLMLIDDLGDSLWTKTYSQGANSYDTPYSMVVCSDGGFAMAGESNGPPNVKGLLIKTDSGGNLINSVPKIDEVHNIGMFPIPCSDYIKVQIDKLIFGEIHFEIFDYLGKLVKVCKFDSRYEYKIDTHDLINGIYFINFSNKYVKNYLGKFIVLH